MSSRCCPSSTSSLDLHQYIELLSQGHIKAAENYKQFDEEGTALWNLSWKLKNQNETSAQLVCLGKIVLCSVLYAILMLRPVRVLSCLLLDCAQKGMIRSIQSWSSIASEMHKPLICKT